MKHATDRFIRVRHAYVHLQRALLVSIVSTLLVVAAVTQGTTSAAGTASFSVSPNSSNFVQNTMISLTINVTSPEPINAIESDLQYDSTKLQFSNIDTSGSAFGTAAIATGGGGSVQIARGTSPGTTVSGTQKVASVVFKVLGGSGITPVSFANTSHIVRAADSTEAWNGSTAGGTYSLSTPTPTPTPDVTPLDLQESDVPVGDDPELAPDDSELSSNDTGNDPVPLMSDIANQGSLVAVIIIGQDGKPIVDAQVRIGSQKVNTDRTGTASFLSIDPGSHLVNISYGETRHKSTIHVKNTGDAVQTFTLKSPQPKHSIWSNPFYFVGLPVGGITCLTILALLIKHRKRKRLEADIAARYAGAVESTKIQPYDTRPLEAPVQVNVAGTTVSPTQSNYGNSNQSHYPWADTNDPNNPPT